MCIFNIYLKFKGNVNECPGALFKTCKMQLLLKINVINVLEIEIFDFLYGIISFFGMFKECPGALVNKNQNLIRKMSA